MQKKTHNFTNTLYFYFSNRRCGFHCGHHRHRHRHRHLRRDLLLQSVRSHSHIFVLYISLCRIRSFWEGNVVSHVCLLTGGCPDVPMWPLPMTPLTTLTFSNLFTIGTPITRWGPPPIHVSHTSIGKRLIGLQLRGFLVRVTQRKLQRQQLMLVYGDARKWGQGPILKHQGGVTMHLNGSCLWAPLKDCVCAAFLNIKDEEKSYISTELHKL